MKHQNLYLKVSKRAQIFQRMSGVTPQQFQEIAQKLSPFYEKMLAKKQKQGRPMRLASLQEQIFVILLYYRSYITQEYIGWLTQVDAATICRVIKKITPLLSKIMILKKESILTKEEINQLIVDATEQPIERPVSSQKVYYSGKKKRHTLKTEILMNHKGRILRISKPYPGSVHDKKVRDQELPLPSESEVLADSGYQGLQHIHKRAYLPIKKEKRLPLSEINKVYNQTLSRLRVKVEHKIGEMKVFRILKDTFRNKRRNYGLITGIIAGIVNLKSGFGI